MIFATLFILVILALGGGLAGLLITGLGPVKRKILAGPVCGKCGYSVVGLTTMTCPECGGDLRVSGIVTPGTPQHTGALAAYFFFTSLLVFIALVGSGALLSVVPVRRSFDRDVQLAGPHSKAYQRIAIHAHEATWGAGRRSLPVEIELVPNLVATAPASSAQAMPPRMTVRPGAGYEYLDGSSRVASQDAFGANAVLAWMKIAGIDTAAGEVQREAARVAGQAHAAVRGAGLASSQARYNGLSSSSSTGSDLFNSISTSEAVESQVQVFVPIGLAGFWLAVWIAGLVFLSGRRRHQSPVTEVAGEPKE
jgi:hypothetical protein